MGHSRKKICYKIIDFACLDWRWQTKYFSEQRDYAEIKTLGGKMFQPTFSVIVPVHNRAHLIAECVDSIFGQSFSDFELILVDNNSTDDLASAISPFDDSRLTIVSCSIPGPSAARMKGVSVAKGNYLSFLDSDDIWRHDVLEQVLLCFQEQPQTSAVYLSALTFRSGSMIEWQTGIRKSVKVVEDLLEALWAGAPGACALAGADRSLFENGNGFAPELWVGEDVDWALRHASTGPVYLLCDEPRLAYRRHDENITKDTTRYESWAHELLGFAKTERYATNNGNLRVFIVAHLIGQLQTILRARGFRSFLKIYPKVVALGIRWRVFRPLFMPTLFSAYFRTKLNNFVGVEP